MKRFLLFDSGCNLCTRLAQNIEEESEGWLVARSLRDPEMHALLRKARPDWRWQPTLLEVKDDNINIITGVALTAKFVQELGLRRAWRVVKLINQVNGASNGINLGRRKFLQRGGALLATLPLLGLPAPWRGLSMVGTTILDWQVYRDKDFGFTLEYPTGWQAEIKEEQPKPLIDDEAILKRVVFSSSPALVYLDVWLAQGKNLKEWLEWYKETRLVEQMLTNANATVAGVPAAMFLQEHQRDLMITYFSDGQYVYRLLNWMTVDPSHMDAYWHMLNTFNLQPDVSGPAAAEVPLWVRQESARSAERSMGMLLVNECCNHNDSGNPFPCCGCNECCACEQEGNCTWWVYYKYGYVPFTGNAGTWWGQAVDHSAWDTASAPSTCKPSIGCWNTGQFGHVAYAASYSGGGTVNISDMSWCDHCDETDNISISDPSQGWIYPSQICA